MKVSFQSLLAKRGTLTANDNVFLNMLIFLAAALLFSPYLFAASAVVWLYAAAYALCNVVFQIAYTCALSRGNVSTTVMFANFGMVMPIAVSCLAYGDSPSTLRMIGICLIACVFILNTQQDRSRKRGYFIFVIVAMLANGAGLSVQKLFVYFDNGDRVLQFVSASYLLGALLCGMVCFLPPSGGKKRTVLFDRRTLFAALGAGISLALFLALNTYAAGIIDGSFHYPAHSGCAILLSTLSGVLLFKDRLSQQQWVACILGGMGIILMNF